MLNTKGIRELAYLVEVTDVEQMNADRLEAVCINGWRCVCEKGIFHKGDIAIFFEIDSKLPEVEPFIQNEFLKSKKFKIKSQKIRGVVSQGLIMHPNEFGWYIGSYFDCNLGKEVYYVDDGKVYHFLNDESRFLTEQLGVTYAVEDDNARKSNSVDKYKKMAQRHPKIVKTWWWRLLYRYEFSKKILFYIFGKKRDIKTDWPSWVKKTDEERIQNCTWILKDTEELWYPTEKIDGSSTTFTYSIKNKRKPVFLVCSRNVVFDKPGKKCFYDTNIYTEMAEKYDMKNKLKEMITDLPVTDAGKVEYVTVQAETYGAGVQKRDYGINGHDMAIFNIIFGFTDGSSIRLNPVQGIAYATAHGLPYVPVLDVEGIHLPDNCDEVLQMSGAEKSKIDGGMREGIVFRSKDGKKSFKAVSNEFLLKYHG